MKTGVNQLLDSENTCSISPPYFDTRCSMLLAHSCLVHVRISGGARTSFPRNARYEIANGRLHSVQVLKC